VKKFTGSLHGRLRLRCNGEVTLAWAMAMGPVPARVPARRPPPAFYNRLRAAGRPVSGGVKGPESDGRRRLGHPSVLGGCGFVLLLLLCSS
jgi:hypothetical protein